MPGPNSWLFLIALVGGFAGLVVWLLRANHAATKVLAAVLAFVVSTIFGAGLVNNFYDYYTSWTALYDDLTNAGAVGYSQAALAHTAHRSAIDSVPAAQIPVSSPPTVASPPAGGPVVMSIPSLNLRAVPDPGRGRLVRMDLPGGQANTMSRVGYVYLPPQYFEPAYADVRFPVLELLHGDPGEPNNWVYGLRLPAVMDSAIRAGRLGPMVIVMPATFTGPHGNDCVDGSAGERNDTYLTHDVPADITARFRVLPQGPNWGIGGLSDGGFCAANLALRHRGSYGAVASMDGFFTVQADLGVLRRALSAEPGALAANDPISHVTDAAPLPRFWLMAGTGNRLDLSSAQGFRAVLQQREPIRYVVVDGGRHSPPAWRAVLPDLLSWAWSALSGEAAPTGTEVLGLGGQTPKSSPPAAALASPTAPSASASATAVVAAPTATSPPPLLNP